MLRAILADDEAVILKGLRKLIDWEKMGIQIVGEARDGKEALELIERVKPDLAVSDIAMPELDGLDMLKRIGEMGLYTKVIFVSGYQEFSYAKRAVKYGAVDYILKPVEQEELEAALKKAVGLVDEQSRLKLLATEQDESELARIFHKINGNQEYARQDLYEQFEALHIDVACKEFVGAAFRLYFTKSGPSNIKMQELQKFSAYNRLQKKLEEEKWGFVIRKDLNNCYVIFTLDPSEDAGTVRIRTHKLAEVMTSGQPIVVKTGVGERIGEIGALQLAYKTSRFALELYYFTEEDEIWYDDVERSFLDSFEDYQNCYKKLMEGFLSRKPSIDMELNRILMVIRNLHFGNRFAAVNRCILLITDVTKELMDNYLIDGSYRQKAEQAAEEIRLKPLYRQACQVITACLTDLFETVKDGTGNTSQSEVARIKQYIGAHYRENLTLESMAAFANMNLYYFSSYFKKNTGQNFKNYLTDIRMKEAGRLLANTDCKAYEAAEAVGYKNVRQFNENFKGKYGKSPNEYRREYRPKGQGQKI